MEFKNSGGFRGLRLPDDLLVTVCDGCKRACCWQGEFMCDEALTSGTAELTIAELKKIQPTIDGEHWEFWEKDVDAIEWLAENPQAAGLICVSCGDSLNGKNGHAPVHGAGLVCDGCHQRGQ